MLTTVKNIDPDDEPHQLQYLTPTEQLIAA